MDNLLDAEKDFQIQTLENRIKELDRENSKYKILLGEADPDANISDISDSEVICVEQLARLRKESGGRELTTEEVKNLDVLQKNLKIARGENIRVNSRSSSKKASKEELEKALKG